MRACNGEVEMATAAMAGMTGMLSALVFKQQVFGFQRGKALPDFIFNRH
jgi:hypothetical protein